MKSLLKSIQTAHAEGSNWRRDLQKFLLNVRCTPHSTTCISPPELLYNRKIKGKLPCFFGALDLPSAGSSAVLRDFNRKSEAKNYPDAKRGAIPSHLKVEAVLVKQRRHNKLH